MLWIGVADEVVPHLRMKENLLVSVMVKLGNFLVFAIDRSYLFFSRASVSYCRVVFLGVSVRSFVGVRNIGRHLFGPGRTV
jgi:hypothetical protein